MRSATNKDGLLVAIEIGVLEHERNVLTLLHRMKAERKRKSKQARREGQFVDSSLSLPLNMLDAIREYAMNMRNSDVGRQYASKSEGGAIDPSSLPNEDAVCMILEACDLCQMQSLEHDGSSHEHSQLSQVTLSKGT